MKYYLYYTALMCAMLCTGLAAAQSATGVLSITEGDTVLVDCTNPCDTLHAACPNIQKTTSYSVNTISYAPSSITGSTVSLAGDDFFSTAVSIGFDFCFYGAQYSQVYISDNGQLTFNAAYNGTAASFATQSALPYFNSSFPDAAIFGPMVDAKLSIGGSISTATIGTAPFRKFVVKYDAVAFFNNNCGAQLTSTFQIELLETYNSVQCFIGNKPTCNSNSGNWLNYATLGIQSGSAANFLTATGKNSSIWTSTNEGYEFAPNGGIAYTVKWTTTSNSNVLASTSAFNVCASQTKSYVATVQLNCPSNVIYTDTITLVVSGPKIDSIHKQKPICESDTNGCITIFATGLAPLQYSNNGISWGGNNTVCGLGAYGATVYVKDASGCITNISEALGAQSNPDIQVLQLYTDQCPLQNGGATVTVNGGVGPYTYSWNTGDLDSFLNNVPGDTNYILTVTDALGCTDVKNIYVPADSIPIINPVLVKPTCSQANGSITVNISGSPGPYTYQWLGSGNTSNVLSNVGSGIYSVTVTAINGCNAGTAIALNDTLTTQLAAARVHTKCNLANGKITLTAYGGLAPYSYEINGVSCGATISNVAAGTYTVKATDANGCSQAFTVTINASIAPSLQFLLSNAHCDTSNGSATAIPINALGNVQYIWDNGVVGSSIADLAPGAYVCTITDSILCTVSDTIIIGDDGSPHLQIVSYQSPLCYNDSTGIIELNGISGIGPYKYSLDNINFSAVAQIDNINGGTFTIYIKDASGCVRDTIVSLNQPPPLVVTTGTPKKLACYYDLAAPEPIIVTGGIAPYLTSILSGEGTVGNGTITGMVIGDNIIVVQDKNGCADTSTITVLGPTQPLTIIPSVEDVACFETNTGSITITSSGGWPGQQISWAEVPSSNGNSSIKNLSAGVYHVTITDKEGCVVDSALAIKQLYCCTSEMPNAFTPDGDNTNDLARVLTASDINEVLLRIYNRYGQMVFETKDWTQGWNGTYNAQQCDAGTYFYVVRYNCVQDTKIRITSGDLILLR
jgi:gliding motility-associated-like protein